MKKHLPLFVIALILVIHSSIFAQWGPDKIISPQSMSAQLNENAYPCLAVSGDTLHVVWSDHRTNGYAIYYSQSPDSGTTWSNAVSLTDTAAKASMPSIAVSGSTVHVVWMDSLNGIRASYYKRSLDGGMTWGNTVLLDFNTAFWPGVGASGSLVVITLNKQVIVSNSEVFAMISYDNGTTLGAEQQISNAPGRSEDPAVAVKGSYIHLSWNDNRSGTMLIYYRRSADAGVTWGTETALTALNSYSSMVCLDDTNADVPLGEYVNGYLQVNIRQSGDTGSNFSPIQQLTFTSVTELYPHMVRNGMNLYMVYYKFGIGGGPWYLHSGDGGATWDSTYALGFGGQPFIAYTGCNLHVIWPDSGKIHYRNDPTGNCGNITTAIAQHAISQNQVRVFPNPFSTQITIEISSADKIENAELKVFDLLGKELITMTVPSDRKIVLNTNKLSSGIYIYKLFQADAVIATGKMVVE